MNEVRYITNERGNPVEVILPIKRYRKLMDLKEQYEEKLRVLYSIKAGAEEVLKDRINNGLNQELSDFIDELEDNSH
ncbi:MAG: hypothetical protein NT166_12200 [Candidatus Aminicenantes bacterium]|jgi:hypothetical protein|nr:hypothetical protein [Candidatus Aminicenantes bacterium]